MVTILRTDTSHKGTYIYGIYRNLKTISYFATHITKFMEYTGSDLWGGGEQIDDSLLKNFFYHYLRRIIFILRELRL